MSVSFPPVAVWMASVLEAWKISEMGICSSSELPCMSESLRGLGAWCLQTEAQRALPAGSALCRARAGCTVSRASLPLAYLDTVNWRLGTGLVATTHEKKTVSRCWSRQEGRGQAWAFCPKLVDHPCPHWAVVKNRNCEMTWDAMINITHFKNLIRPQKLDHNAL